MSAGGHVCTYLHSRFRTELPALYDKLKRYALRANAAGGWNLADGASITHRTIELLNYTAPAGGNGTTPSPGLGEQRPCNTHHVHVHVHVLSMFMSMSMPM